MVLEAEESGLFFVIALIRLLPEVSVPRSLKVPELWTLQSGIKAVQWCYKHFMSLVCASGFMCFGIKLLNIRQSKSEGGYE